MITLFKDYRLKNAIIKNDVANIKYLLSDGKTSNLMVDNKPALIFAIENGYFDAASELIKSGVNLSETDDGNYSALHYAFINTETPFRIIKDLVTHGADVNASSFICRTPIQLACMNGDLVGMKYLLEHGASKFDTDMFGNTLMHIACTNDYKYIIQFLVKNELNLYAKNNRGVTAFNMLPQKSRDNFLLKTPVVAQNVHLPLNKSSMDKLNKDNFTPPKRFDSLGVKIPMRVESLNSPASSNSTPSSKIKNDLSIPKRLESLGTKGKNLTSPAYKKSGLSKEIKKELPKPKRFESLGIQNPMKEDTLPLESPIELSLSSKMTYTQLVYGACKSKNVEYTKYLIELGADITAKDLLGNNILLKIACENNDIKMLRLLVSNGLDIFDKNVMLQSPIELLSPSVKKAILTEVYKNNPGIIKNPSLNKDEVLYLTSLDKVKSGRLKRFKSVENTAILNKTKRTLMRSISLANINKKSNKDLNL